MLNLPARTKSLFALSAQHQLLNRLTPVMSAGIRILRGIIVSGHSLRYNVSDLGLSRKWTQYDFLGKYEVRQFKMTGQAYVQTNAFTLVRLPANWLIVWP